jgi:peroxiredoxin
MAHTSSCFALHESAAVATALHWRLCHGQDMSQIRGMKTQASFLRLFLVACGARPLDSGSQGNARYPIEGVDQRNLQAKPRSSPVKLGDEVPVLSLFDQQGNAVSTREATASRNVVFLFFPGHDDPQARPVYEWVTRNRQQLANHQVEILLVTAMDEPGRNAFVAGQHSLGVGILHDPSAWAARAFGLLDARNSTNVSQVWSIVVGKGGEVIESRNGLYDFTEILTLTTMRPSKPGSFRAFDMIREP